MNYDQLVSEGEGGMERERGEVEEVCTQWNKQPKNSSLCGG